MQRKLGLVLLLMLVTAPLFAASQVHVYKGAGKDKFWWGKEVWGWEDWKGAASLYLVVKVADDGTVEEAQGVAYWKEDGRRFYEVFDPCSRGIRFWVLSSTVRAVTLGDGNTGAEVGWGKVKSSSTSPVASSYKGYQVMLSTAKGEGEMGVSYFAVRRDSKRSTQADGMGVGAYLWDVLIPYLQDRGYGQEE